MNGTDTMKLRPYQNDAIDAIRHEWGEEGNASTLISLPTGCGKTIVFSSLISTLLDEDKGARALVVAHRDELVEQAVEKMALVNPFIQAGVVKGPRHEVAPRFVVGSIQSFNASRLRRLRSWKVDYLVIDEAHHAQEDNYYGKLVTALRAVNPDLKVLGVTATPFRGDRKGLGGVFASCCYSYGIVEAIESGYLTPLRGVVVRTATDLDAVRQGRDGDFTEGSLAQVVDTANRNELVVESWQKHANGCQAVAFACNVKHAQNMAATFQAKGVRAAAVWGNMGTDARKATLKSFAKGDLDVLTNCGVLTEGWDYPALGAVLLARPTQSRVLYAQAVGRATRLAPGKDEALVIDFTDNCTRLSLASLVDLTDPERARAIAEGRIQGEPVQREETFQIKPKGEGLRTWAVNLFGGAASRAAGWSTFGRDLVASAGDVEAIIRPNGQGWRLSLFRASGGEGTKRKGGEVTLNEARRLAAQDEAWRIRLECVGGRRKAAFWSVEGKGAVATVRWGAIGTPGREQTVTRAEAIRRAGQKLAGGYAYATQGKPAVEHIEGDSLGTLTAQAQAAFDAEGVGVLMRANAAWKAKPATGKQITALRRWNVPEVELHGITAGEAAARMTHLILRRRLRDGGNPRRPRVSTTEREVASLWASFG